MVNPIFQAPFLGLYPIEMIGSKLLRLINQQEAEFKGFFKL